MEIYHILAENLLFSVLLLFSLVRKNRFLDKIILTYYIFSLLFTLVMIFEIYSIIDVKFITSSDNSTIKIFEYVLSFISLILHSVYSYVIYKHIFIQEFFSFKEIKK